MYLSDLPWSSATNGWGPVERDQSNGEQGASDGQTITLNGITYAKGLGVNSHSEIIYDLAGRYTEFISAIDIDDDMSGYGSVVFQVWADDAMLYESGVMTGTMATKGVRVSVADKQQLRLVVTDAGDNIYFDHADWAGARLVAR